MTGYRYIYLTLSRGRVLSVFCTLSDLFYDFRSGVLMRRQVTETIPFRGVPCTYVREGGEGGVSTFAKLHCSHKSQERLLHKFTVNDSQ